MNDKYESTACALRDFIGMSDKTFEAVKLVLRESFPEAKPATVPSADDWKVYLCLPQKGDPRPARRMGETCRMNDTIS